MRIYALTALGQKLARSTNTPDTGAWRIVHTLDRQQQASDERLISATGLSDIQLAAAIRSLRARRIVAEVGVPDVT